MSATELVDRVVKELETKMPMSRKQVESVISVLQNIGILRSLGEQQAKFVLQDDEHGLTSMSFAEYQELSQAQREHLALKLQDRNWNRIQSELERHSAQWMLVCGGEVLRWGSTWAHLPTDQELKEIGQTTGKVPLVFARNPQIEETNWASLPSDDWYPTLEVRAEFTRFLPNALSRLNEATSFRICESGASE